MGALRSAHRRGTSSRSETSGGTSCDDAGVRDVVKRERARERWRGAGAGAGRAGGDGGEGGEGCKPMDEGGDCGAPGEQLCALAFGLL